MKFEIASSVNKLLAICTPIGNLSEVSPRVTEALSTCDIIFCEDTRTTGMLLKKLNITKPQLISNHDHNERERFDQIIASIKSGKKCGIVSDAGYPAFSDPGAIAIKECIKNGIPIEVINGPSPIIHALLASGFTTKKFVSIGFLPPKGKARSDALEEALGFKMPCVLFESPHRIKNLLQQIDKNEPNRKIAVCRELTKLHETIYIGAAKEIEAQLNEKGEFVVVISESEAKASILSDKEIIDLAKELAMNGIKKTEISKILAKQTGVNSTKIYSILIKSGVQARRTRESGA